MRTTEYIDLFIFQKINIPLPGVSQSSLPGEPNIEKVVPQCIFVFSDYLTCFVILVDFKIFWGIVCLIPPPIPIPGVSQNPFPGQKRIVFIDFV